MENLSAPLDRSTLYQLQLPKNRPLKSRSQVSPTTLRRIVEYFFRSQPARIDELTPHLSVRHRS